MTQNSNKESWKQPHVIHTYVSVYINYTKQDISLSLHELKA